MVLMRSPLDTLHTPIVLSQDPDAKYFPFGENTTLTTVEEWPMIFMMFSPIKSLLSFSLSSIFLFFFKYTLSNALPKLSSPLLNKIYLFLPPTFSVLIISYISFILSFSSYQILLMSSSVFFSISCMFWNSGRRISSLFFNFFWTFSIV